MPIGNNMDLKDRLIKSTTNITSNTNNKSTKTKDKKASKANVKNKTIITSKARTNDNGNNKNNTSNVSNESKKQKTSIANNVSKARKDTENTVKMTFYIKADLLKNIYNYSYWDRLSLTRAFNKVVKDGLKGKDTSQRKDQ